MSSPAVSVNADYLIAGWWNPSEGLDESPDLLTSQRHLLTALRGSLLQDAFREHLCPGNGPSPPGAVISGFDQPKTLRTSDQPKSSRVLLSW
jgi:hypothetical protein